VQQAIEQDARTYDGFLGDLHDVLGFGDGACEGRSGPAACRQKCERHGTRELRSWLSELQDDYASSVGELDRKTRRAVLARLLAEVEAQRSGEVGDVCTFVWSGERLVPEAEFDPLADPG